MSAAAVPTAPPPSSGGMDAYVHVSGVTWEQYEALCLAFDEHPSVRLTYCEGELDIMVTSPTHERIKKILARLVEIYALECGADLNGYGQTTFRKRAKERGLEPDECYVLGAELADVPDLAIEVAPTSGGIDKLEVYAGLAIPEVWIWREGTIEVWRLEPGRGYVRRERSALLPALDLEVLSRFLDWPNQTAAVRAFRETLTR